MVAHDVPTHVTDDSTGTNIAMLRKAAGLTQGQLAQRANVSKSLLSKVEIGDRSASHALVVAVARALRIPIERVHGQPYDAAHLLIDELRAALRAYDLPAGGPEAPRPLEVLRAETAAVAESRRRGLYARIGERLPRLLGELTATALTADGAERRTAFRLLVSCYYVAHGLAHRLGYHDLAESIEHKLAWAAAQAGDPLAAGLAGWTRAGSFQASGDYDHGLRLLQRTRTRLDPLLRTGPAAIVVAGSAHLRAVTLASRAGDAVAVREHLQAARRLADDLATGDQVHYHLTFGPANIRIHAVAAHVELGQIGQAIALGEAFTPPASMPPTRTGHHYIDLARAHLAADDRPAALRALRQARRIAPEQTRYHPMVRETARVLISAHRRANRDLSQLAAWLGLVV